MTVTLQFPIEGMSCASCVGRAERAIKGVEGVDAAQVNLATHSGSVTLHDAKTAEAVRQALDKAGYPAAPDTQVLEVADMTCASCVARVEKALHSVPGVIDAQANLADGTARVTTLGSPAAALVDALKGIGYAASPRSTATPTTDRQAREEADLYRRFVIAAVLTLPVFLLEMGGHIFPALHHAIAQTIGLQTSWLIQFALTGLVLAWPGRMFFVKGAATLRRLAPDMNALVALGAGAAFLYSCVSVFLPGLLPPSDRAVYFEAAAVIVTLILLGRWLEARAKGKTGAAIARLAGLRPDTATVLRDGRTDVIPLANVRVNDVLLIRAGGQVPVDAVVTEGHSFVDESMLTGEPVAVEKQPGDGVTAGTINGNGTLQVRATAIGSDTVLSRIIAMVSDAQSTRLPVQDMVNAITMWFVPAVLAVAALTTLVWLFIGTVPQALVAGVSVLIIACPCAMGLAVPVAIMVGMGRAADLGVLFRRGEAMQRLQDVDTVVFDKTGTLTAGETRVAQTITLDMDEARFLAQIAAVERESDHPLARAIVAAAGEGADVAVSQVVAHPGKGLSAKGPDGDILIGTAAFLTDAGIDPAPLTAAAEAQSNQGRTPVLVAIGGRAAGLVAIADTMRPTTADTIAGLKAQGLTTALLSGDTPATTRALAASVGIDTAVGGLLPDGKVEALRGMGDRTAFVGDGINDAPALAAAHVGVAMGTGTAVAVESADVVLMSGDPAGVLRALRLSRATMRNIRQNLFWAFGYNVVLIPVAAAGYLSPALAAGAMALSSVFVVTNALRLRSAG